MERNKPTKARRGCLTLVFVLSPLGLAGLWCGFIDQESFGAALLGVVFTSLFGAVALVAFVVRKVSGRRAHEIHDA